MNKTQIRDVDTLSDALMECCNGHCRQGRDCPVRQACELWERDDEVGRLDRDGRALARWFFGYLAAVAIAILWAVFG